MESDMEVGNGDASGNNPSNNNDRLLSKLKNYQEKEKTKIESRCKDQLKDVQTQSSDVSQLIASIQKDSQDLKKKNDGFSVSGRGRSQLELIEALKNIQSVQSRIHKVQNQIELNLSTCENHVVVNSKGPLPPGISDPPSLSLMHSSSSSANEEDLGDADRSIRSNHSNSKNEDNQSHNSHSHNSNDSNDSHGSSSTGFISCHSNHDHLDASNRSVSTMGSGNTQDNASSSFLQRLQRIQMKEVEDLTSVLNSVKCNFEKFRMDTSKNLRIQSRLRKLQNQLLREEHMCIFYLGATPEYSADTTDTNAVNSTHSTPYNVHPTQQHQQQQQHHHHNHPASEFAASASCATTVSNTTLSTNATYNTLHTSTPTSPQAPTPPTKLEQTSSQTTSASTHTEEVMETMKRRRNLQYQLYTLQEELSKEKYEWNWKYLLTRDKTEQYLQKQQQGAGVKRRFHDEKQQDKEEQHQQEKEEQDQQVEEHSQREPEAEKEDEWNERYITLENSFVQEHNQLLKSMEVINSVNQELRSVGNTVQNELHKVNESSFQQEQNMSNADVSDKALQQDYRIDSMRLRFQWMKDELNEEKLSYKQKIHQLKQNQKAQSQLNDRKRQRNDYAASSSASDDASNVLMRRVVSTTPIVHEDENDDDLQNQHHFHQELQLVTGKSELLKCIQQRHEQEYQDLNILLELDRNEIDQHLSITLNRICDLQNQSEQILSEINRRMDTWDQQLQQFLTTKSSDYINDLFQVTEGDYDDDDFQQDEDEAAAIPDIDDSSAGSLFSLLRQIEDQYSLEKRHLESIIKKLPPSSSIQHEKRRRNEGGEELEDGSGNSHSQGSVSSDMDGEFNVQNAMQKTEELHNRLIHSMEEEKEFQTSQQKGKQQLQEEQKQKQHQHDTNEKTTKEKDDHIKELEKQLQMVRDENESLLQSLESIEKENEEYKQYIADTEIQLKQTTKEFKELQTLYKAKRERTTSAVEELESILFESSNSRTSTAKWMGDVWDEYRKNQLQLLQNQHSQEKMEWESMKSSLQRTCSGLTIIIVFCVCRIQQIVSQYESEKQFLQDDLTYSKNLCETTNLSLINANEQVKQLSVLQKYSKSAKKTNKKIIDMMEQQQQQEHEQPEEGETEEDKERRLVLLQKQKKLINQHEEEAHYYIENNNKNNDLMSLLQQFQAHLDQNYQITGGAGMSSKKLEAIIRASRAECDKYRDELHEIDSVLQQNENQYEQEKQKWEEELNSIREEYDEYRLQQEQVVKDLQDTSSNNNSNSDTQQNSNTSTSVVQQKNTEGNLHDGNEDNANSNEITQPDELIVHYKEKVKDLEVLLDMALAQRDSINEEAEEGSDLLTQLYQLTIQLDEERGDWRKQLKAAQRDCDKYQLVASNAMKQVKQLQIQIQEQGVQEQGQLQQRQQQQQQEQQQKEQEEEKGRNGQQNISRGLFSGESGEETVGTSSKQPQQKKSKGLFVGGEGEKEMAQPQQQVKDRGLFFGTGKFFGGGGGNKTSENEAELEISNTDAVARTTADDDAVVAVAQKQLKKVANDDDEEKRMLQDLLNKLQDQHDEERKGWVSIRENEKKKLQSEVQRFKDELKEAQEQHVQEKSKLVAFLDDEKKEIQEQLLNLQDQMAQQTEENKMLRDGKRSLQDELREVQDQMSKSSDLEKGQLDVISKLNSEKKQLIYQLQTVSDRYRQERKSFKIFEEQVIQSQKEAVVKQEESARMSPSLLNPIQMASSFSFSKEISGAAQPQEVSVEKKKAGIRHYLSSLAGDDKKRKRQDCLREENIHVSFSTIVDNSARREKLNVDVVEFNTDHCPLSIHIVGVEGWDNDEVLWYEEQNDHGKDTNGEEIVPWWKKPDADADEVITTLCEKVVGKGYYDNNSLSPFDDTNEVEDGVQEHDRSFEKNLKAKRFVTIAALKDDGKMANIEIQKNPTREDRTEMGTYLRKKKQNEHNEEDGGLEVTFEDYKKFSEQNQVGESHMDSSTGAIGIGNQSLGEARYKVNQSHQAVSRGFVDNQSQQAESKRSGGARPTQAEERSLEVGKNSNENREEEFDLLKDELEKLRRAEKDLKEKCNELLEKEEKRSYLQKQLDNRTEEFNELRLKAESCAYLQRKLDEKIKECDELREESKYLKDQLKLSSNLLKEKVQKCNSLENQLESEKKVSNQYRVEADSCARLQEQVDILSDKAEQLDSLQEDLKQFSQIRGELESTREECTLLQEKNEYFEEELKRLKDQFEDSQDKLRDSQSKLSELSQRSLLHLSTVEHGALTDPYELENDPFELKDETLEELEDRLYKVSSTILTRGAASSKEEKMEENKEEVKDEQGDEGMEEERCVVVEQNNSKMCSRCVELQKVHDDEKRELQLEHEEEKKELQSKLENLTSELERYSSEQGRRQRSPFRSKKVLRVTAKGRGIQNKAKDDDEDNTDREDTGKCVDCAELQNKLLVFQERQAEEKKEWQLKTAEAEKSLEDKSTQVEKLSQELNELQSKFDSSRENCDELQSKVDSSREECNELQSKFDSSREECNELQSKFDLSRDECKDLQSKFDLSREECNSLREKIESYRVGESSSKQELRDMTSKLDLAQSEIDKCSADAEDRMQELKDQHAREKDEMEQQLEAARQESVYFIEIEKEFSELKNQLILFQQRLEAEKAELAAELNVTKSERDSVCQQVQELQSKVLGIQTAHEKELKDLTDQLEATKADIDYHRQVAEDTRIQLEQAQKSEQKSGRLEHLESQLRLVEEECNELREKADQFDEVQDQLDLLRQQYDAKAVIDDEHQHRHIDMQSDLKPATDETDEEGKGPVTPEEKCNKLEQELEQLQGHLENAQNEIEYYRKTSEEAYSTMDDQLEALKNQYVEDQKTLEVELASVQRENTTLSEKARRCEELQEQLHIVTNQFYYERRKWESERQTEKDVPQKQGKEEELSTSAGSRLEHVDDPAADLPGRGEGDNLAVNTSPPREGDSHVAVQTPRDIEFKIAVDSPRDSEFAVESPRDSEFEAATSPQESEVLPEGWTEEVDPSSGETYYFNEVDNTSTWERPSLMETDNNQDHAEPADYPNVDENTHGSDAGSPGDEPELSAPVEPANETRDDREQEMEIGEEEGGQFDEPSSLPEGWVELVDPSSGETYYFNELNDTSTWERPVKEYQDANADNEHFSTHEHVDHYHQKDEADRNIHDQLEELKKQYSMDKVEMEGELEALRKECEGLREEKKTWKGELDAAHANREGGVSSGTDSQAVAESTFEVATEPGDSGRRSEAKTLDDELEQLKEQFHESKRELELQLASNENLTLARDRLQQEKDELMSQLDLVRAERDQLKQASDEAEAQLKEKAKTVDDELEQLKEQYHESKRGLELQMVTNKNLQQEKDTLEQEKNDLMSQLDLGKAERDRLKQTSDQVENQLKEKAKTFDDEVIHIKEQYDESRRELESQLAVNQALQEVSDRLEQEKSNLVLQLNLVTSERDKLKEKAEGAEKQFEEKAKTLDDELERHKEQYEESRREVELQLAANQALQQVKDRLEQEQGDLMSKLNSGTAERDELKERADEAKKQLEQKAKTLDDEVKQVKEQYNNSKRELELQLASNQAMQQVRDRLEQEKDSLMSQLDLVKAERDTLKQTADEAEKQLEQMKSQHHANKKGLDELVEVLSKLQELQDQQEIEKRKWKDELEQTKAENDKYRETAAEAYANLEDQLDELEGQYSREKKELEAKLEIADNEKELLKVKLEERTKQDHELQAVKSQFAEEKSKWEEQVQSNNAECDGCDKLRKELESERAKAAVVGVGAVKTDDMPDKLKVLLLKKEMDQMKEQHEEENGSMSKENMRIKEEIVAVKNECKQYQEKFEASEKKCAEVVAQMAKLQEQFEEVKLRADDVKELPSLNLNDSERSVATPPHGSSSRLDSPSNLSPQIQQLRSQRHKKEEEVQARLSLLVADSNSVDDDMQPEG